MKKLLVVEDHVFYRTILSKLLVEYELAIHASLSEVPQPLDCYDVILTDGNHGEGVALGGVVVIQQAGSVPVVAMSNNEEYIKAMTDAGAQWTYHKGTSPTLLKNALASALAA